MTRLSLAEARRLHLHAQGLLTNDPFGRGKDGALKALEHLGYVQIDTISVVERAHHHVFWSRVSDYKPSVLHELTLERTAFEYWSHAASYLPMRDFAYSLPRKKQYASGKNHWFEQTDEHKKLRRQILKRIEKEGALAARHFESPEKAQGWFNWKPSKQVLEQLFMEGRLMISHRQGFDKIYDLTDRVVPARKEIETPTREQYARHLIESFLRSQAFGTAAEIAYLRRYQGPYYAALVKKGVKQGWLERIEVEGLEGDIVVDAASFQRQRDKAAAVSGEARARILSPFDSAVIRRQRLLDLHGLDYQIECYVPGPKRKFGYFCLPVMVGDRFVGRLDAKAHRAEKTLEVVKLFIENKAVPVKTAKDAIREELERFARFNGCTKVRGRV